MGNGFGAAKLCRRAEALDAAAATIAEDAETWVNQRCRSDTGTHSRRPNGGFLCVAVRILPASAGCHAERRPGGAGRGVRHLGIVSKVADELHAIQVLHGDPSVRSPSRKGKQ